MEVSNYVPDHFIVKAKIIAFGFRPVTFRGYYYVTNDDGAETKPASQQNKPNQQESKIKIRTRNVILRGQCIVSYRQSGPGIDMRDILRQKFTDCVKNIHRL